MIVSAFAVGRRSCILSWCRNVLRPPCFFPSPERSARAVDGRRPTLMPFKNSDGDLTFDVGLAGSSFSYSFAEQSNFSPSAVPSSDGSEAEELGDSEITTRVHERDASQTDRRT
jgi:hypothetical protein